MMPRGRVMVPYQKKAKLWVGLGGSRLTFVADSTGILGTHAFTSPQTVLRSLFEYTIMPTSAPVAGDAATIIVGLAKVSTDAATLGATAMPDPVAEEGFPWLYWASHPLTFNNATNATGEVNARVRQTVDVRTQRKFQDRETLVLIAQYEDLSGAPPLTIVSGGMRVLTTLH